MKLNETVVMMDSIDFKERFKAEYFQLQIRRSGLETTLYKYKNKTLGFTPLCSYDLLNAQLQAMNLYSYYLEERAKIEGVELCQSKTYTTH